jgi:hypothetical protein
MYCVVHQHIFMWEQNWDVVLNITKCIKRFLKCLKKPFTIFSKPRPDFSHIIWKNWYFSITISNMISTQAQNITQSICNVCVDLTPIFKSFIAIIVMHFNNAFMFHRNLILTSMQQFKFHKYARKVCFFFCL